MKKNSPAKKKQKASIKKEIKMIALGQNEEVRGTRQYENFYNLVKKRINSI